MKQLRPFFPECYRAIANGKGTVKINLLQDGVHQKLFLSPLRFIYFSILNEDTKSHTSELYF